MLGQKQVIEMIAMQIEGNSIETIAEAYNLTKGRVSQILNKDENQRLKDLMIERIALQRADQIAEGKTELEKIKYHIRLINDRLRLIDSEIDLDFHSDSIASLEIEMDWSEDDLNRAHDIFERYCGVKFRNYGYQLESALRREFGIGAGSAKEIIVAFWRSDKWVDVCVEYAKANQCVEYHEIYLEGKDVTPDSNQ